MLTNKVHEVEVSSIQFSRDDRQRSEVDVSDLVESVRKRGVIQPILINYDHVLIAGERRLTAAREVGLTHLLCRFAEEHDPFELQMLEYEENFNRQDLPWQDHARAMQRMWNLYCTKFPEATQLEFSAFSGFSTGHISQYLTAAEELASGNQRVADQTSINKAANVIRRERDRVVNNAIADIMDSIAAPAHESGVPVAFVPPPEAVINGDFISWAATYSGPRFNLIHCDFPYGLDLDNSEQAGNIARPIYEDSEATYWQLIAALCDNQERIISSSAHMFFWFSMDKYAETLACFQAKLPSFTFEPHPLIWHKTDNKGIVPDVERRPRRVYETCLFGWKGDRKLVRLVSNAYGAPKSTGLHVSEKPEPVLRHFFQLAVDVHTKLLDPTAGSGTALRAAEALGASHVLGLEIDPQHAADANVKIRTARSLAKLSKQVAAE
jgi:ParB/RepB/Spo0J family partition protein